MNDDNAINFSLLRQRANFIRRIYIEEMERHLLAFEKKANDNQIKVRWINDDIELAETVLSICTKNRYKKICFDLDNLPESLSNSTQQIKKISIQDFVNKHENSDLLITKANFAIVETGDIVFINKEINHSFNQVSNLIILLDINKLLIREQDLESILYLQSYYKNHTYLPHDVKIIQTPFDKICEDEIFGSETQNYRIEKVKIYLFLYDNGITTILENSSLREALYCIDCGRCKEVCPVFKVTKQYSPIDLITLKNKNRGEIGKLITKNTTFCGNCDVVCPVNIPFTEIMIKQLEQTRVKGYSEKTFPLSKSFSKRNKMNKLNSKMRRHLFLYRYFGKNKVLFDYYRSQREPFFNIQWRDEKEMH